MAAHLAAVFAVLLVMSPVLVHGGPGHDLLEAVRQHPRLTMFYQALVTTEYSKELSTSVDDKPVTIFAPVDEAIQAATADAFPWDCLTNTIAGKAALKDTLKHHVLKGRFYTVYKLTQTNQVIPADGFPIEVQYDTEKIVITLDGYAHVIEPEVILMENAIVHLIDAVLTTENIYADVLDACAEAPASAPSSLGFADGL
ncbi:hypothetical protein CBR_g49931 [Chara braunii]|uniref:FAS1 domain-containing protein n=1 Tax=Chara braunii TaxID=69332 RepID=A0A388JPG6_CHABU|nr:hypothetical protein CBR_g49931 [Chara braunii]|eukprot:GBG59667.1 hypothetical protein CBR_g49931 [Chara braunii]